MRPPSKEDNSARVSQAAEPSLYLRTVPDTSYHTPGPRVNPQEAPSPSRRRAAGAQMRRHPCPGRASPEGIASASTSSVQAVCALGRRMKKAQRPAFKVPVIPHMGNMSRIAAENMSFHSGDKCGDLCYTKGKFKKHYFSVRSFPETPSRKKLQQKYHDLRGVICQRKRL